MPIKHVLQNMKHNFPSFNALKSFDKFDYIVAALAILLQIQVTLFADIGSKGIRIGLADLVLPFLGIHIIISLIKLETKWPEWFSSLISYCLVGMILVMNIALLNGYLLMGVISEWALFNKYVGFYILLLYMLVGGWLVTNAPHPHKTMQTFITVFVGFFILTLFASVITFFLEPILTFNLWLSNYPWDGFMANRNAFMVIFCLAFVFIIWSSKNSTKIPALLSSLFFLCMPIFFILNDSRTGWIAGISLTILFLSKDTIKRVKYIIPLLCIGAAIAYGSYFVTTSLTVQRGDQMKYFLEAIQSTPEDELKYLGDQKRYIAIEDGLELYKKNNMLLGAGLGSYMAFQIEKRGKFIDIIDFSGLWLLVETGALGLITFSGFFLVCLSIFYTKGFQYNDDFFRALFTFLILFAGMTLLHELMYTRILWFILGLGLIKLQSNISSA